LAFNHSCLDSFRDGHERLFLSDSHFVNPSEMEKFLLESAKIVGTATEEAWSQVHTFTPPDKEKLKLRGKLLAVLSLSGLEEGIEAVASGREVISRLHEEYYGDLEGKAFERLKRAVAKVSSEAALEAKIEIGAAAVVGNTLYLAITGKGQALLRRGSQMGVLLRGEEEVTAASGYLQESDLFLLGTTGFFEAVAKGVIQAALSTGSPAEATETLAPAIHGRPKSGTAAAVIAKIEEVTETGSTISSPLPPKQEEGPRPPTKGLKERIKLFQEQTAGRIATFLNYFQQRLGKKAIYLRTKIERQGKTKYPSKTIFSVVLILLFLLGMSLVLGRFQRKRLGLEETTTLLFEEAKQKTEEGESLLELNPLRARELLLESRDLTQQMEEEGLETSEFKLFKEKLAELLNQICQEHQVEANVFFDLELIKQEAKGDDLAVSGGKVIVLDKAKANVYEVGLGDKKSAILAGGQNLTNASQVAAFLPNVFVLIDEGIIQVNKITKKEELVVEIDEAWGEIIDFWAFAGNLYLLDKKGEIWQYPAIETGFGAQRHWLQDKTLNFSDAVAMAIDGSIWVLKADGTIWKFTRGKEDFFRTVGLDKSLANPTALYTDDDCENLYVLDKGNSRVVVLGKSGEYSATYLWQGIGTVEGIVASEEGGKIFLLDGSKIYEIELQ
jgi:hypothetical protein